MSDVARRTPLASRVVLALVAVVVAASAGLVTLALVNQGEPQVHSFTIESGTSAILDAGGTPANPPPLTLRVSVGDILEVTNADSATHTYAFLVLRPGETGRYTFRNKGVFTGQCTASAHDQITITVT